MAVVTQTALPAGRTNATEVTLTSSNTVTYTVGSGGILTLRNPTAGAISSVLSGADATATVVKGLGSVATNGGFSIGSIAAGQVAVVPLDSVSEYLKGVISLTGTGLVATLTVVQ